MEILVISFIILTCLALVAFFKIHQKQEEIYKMLKNNGNIEIEGQLLEGLKTVAKNTWCYITIYKDFLRITLKDDTNHKYNISLDKITNFEVMSNNGDDSGKDGNYFLIIRFINKNKGINIISFKLSNPEYRLVEYVNSLIKKDNAIGL